MFTGIILGKGKVKAKRPAGGGMTLALETDFPLPDPVEGESIAVNGVCLTARDIRGRHFLADVSPESLTRTNLGRLGVGGVVNLERALRLSDRLGGHMVSGHVDAVTTVLARRALGTFTLFDFAVPPGLGRYIIAKGSVALDGISLTVNEVDEERFSVSIIPHTLEITTLGEVAVGDGVNLEVDLIGKYVEKLLSPKDPAGNRAGEDGSGLDQAFLAKHGFLR
ncbi:riboflavin synthase [Desulfurivibrio alkaliphilus]|uniref:Riboflavin synthase n=1 Tax=Desulfurivibrio alkaliphilus (strain DSM 19089 / UNIQEM U267 / AHT2) TaxID=589865 RepID=D6Z348_DESAT|nr:riboflavin synthase [Desulfurivibrio alkaliphilus]ADH85973.1 riboflavin synthase, alpha subunit [Desulfurivibrio alkaliphilus AHT 2]